MYQQINPNNVENIWHIVAPWIAQAIGDSDTWSDLDTIKENALRGHAHIWIGKDQQDQMDVVFVTETWFLDGRRALVVRWLCGRNMAEWIGDLSYLENWAAQNGFQSLQIWGRKGWIRACKSLGYKNEFTVLSKPLLRGLN